MGSIFLVLRVFLSHFLDCLLFDLVLINRDIWRGIFAALAGVSAGYLNFVWISFSVSAGVCFCVAYCRAILFLRTGRNLFGEYFFLEFCFLFCWLIYNISILFQLFRLGHWTVWWSCGTGSGGKDEI